MIPEEELPVRLAATVLTLMLWAADAGATTQAPASSADDPGIQVMLLGTAGGPTFNADRNGISTLVIAGTERLLFDVGRNATGGMVRLGIKPAQLTRVFLTHLHSDHIIALPELLLFGWAQGRTTPLQVWGPDGTRAMARNLEQAFAFDIHVRRDVDEKTSAEGIKVIATDIREGVVYKSRGVTVTAFLVDHSPVTPAFGYRIDFQGHSVTLSGDTKPSENLVRFAAGTDLLIHEVGWWKQDPQLTAPAARAIAAHHTDGVEAGTIFARVKPKLAVFSHYNADPTVTLALVRQHYAGPVEFGADLMTIAVGSRMTIRRPGAPK
jgi:ribonuclease Z